MRWGKSVQWKTWFRRVGGSGRIQSPHPCLHFPCASRLWMGNPVVIQSELLLWEGDRSAGDVGSVHKKEAISKCSKRHCGVSVCQTSTLRGPYSEGKAGGSPLGGRVRELKRVKDDGRGSLTEPEYGFFFYCFLPVHHRHFRWLSLGWSWTIMSVLNSYSVISNQTQPGYHHTIDETLRYRS